MLLQVKHWTGDSLPLGATGSPKNVNMMKIKGSSGKKNKGVEIHSVLSLKSKSGFPSHLRNLFLGTE